MEKNVLVAYGSWAGSTGEIAEMIAEALQQEGFSASAEPAGSVKDLSPFTAVVLGSAIHAGQLHSDVHAFMKRHNDALSGMPVAYFVACLGMKDSTAENIKEAETYLNILHEKYPEVKPVSQGQFAGALEYKKLSWIFRTILKMMKAEEGDYRDPEAIRGWAKELAAKLG